MNGVTVLLFKMNHSCIKYLAQWWALRSPCGPRGHAPECHRAASASDVVRVRLPVPSMLSPASLHFPLYGPDVYRRVMTLPRVESLRAWPCPFWLPGGLPVAPAAVPVARTMLCHHLFYHGALCHAFVRLGYALGHGGLRNQDILRATPHPRSLRLRAGKTCWRDAPFGLPRLRCFQRLSFAAAMRISLALALGPALAPFRSAISPSRPAGAARISRMAYS